MTNLAPSPAALTRASLARAALALAVSVLTGATAGLALARWPVSPSAAG